MNEIINEKMYEAKVYLYVSQKISSMQKIKNNCSNLI